MAVAIGPTLLYLSLRIGRTPNGVPMSEEQRESQLSPGEAALVERLRAGDEAAFTELVDRYHASMVRLATAYVPSHAVAEEVAQEAWVGVLKGIQRFEGRSSLRTWIFRILTNTAKTKGERENRTIAFSSLWETGPDEPAVPEDRFLAIGDRDAGHWLSAPSEWEVSPEDTVLTGEMLACVKREMLTLSSNQREVMRLRDIEGWTADEVCNALQISETNQRVLLHRARSRVRRALEAYFAGR